MRIRELIKHELLAVFTNHALLLTVFGGVLFYSFLYPLPYAKQLPREQTVVVVDLDGSGLSRRLIRMVNATPQVDIVSRAYSLAQAKEQMIQNKLAGILVIPAHFYTPVNVWSGNGACKAAVQRNWHWIACTV